MSGGFLLCGSAAGERLRLFRKCAKRGNRLARGVRGEQGGVSAHCTLVTRRDRVELLLKLRLLGEFGVAATDEERRRKCGRNACGEEASWKARSNLTLASGQ